MKFYNKLHPNMNCCWLEFSAYLSKGSTVVQNFKFLKHSGIKQNWMQLHPMWIIWSHSCWYFFMYFLNVAINKIMHKFCIYGDNNLTYEGLVSSIASKPLFKPVNWFVLYSYDYTLVILKSTDLDLSMVQVLKEESDAILISLSLSFFPRNITL